MAIELSFTDSFGEQYAKAYWKPVQINISEADQRGMVVFYGYPDAARKGKRLIGQRKYNLDAETISRFLKVTPVDATTVRNAMLSMAYVLAKQTKDVDTGTVDVDNNPIMASFFDKGLDV